MSEKKTKSADRKRGAGRLGVVLGVPILLVVIAGSVWAGVSLFGGSEELTAEYHTVQPREFIVSLKEKGELQASQSTDITCEVEGRSTIISLIEEGAYVNEGDLLVELASDEIEDRILSEELKEASSRNSYESAKTELELQRDSNASSIRKAKLEVELKKLALDKYLQGDWKQQLADADISIEEAEITLDRRGEDFAASKDLFDNGYITKTEFEEDDFRLKQAEWNLEKAKLAKDVLVKYTHKANLEQKQSDLEEAEKELERTKKSAQAEESRKVAQLTARQREFELTTQKLEELREQKDNCRIFAPNNGFVVYGGGSSGGRRYWDSDEQIKEGATVYERQVLMQLPNTTEMLAQLRIHEAKTDRIRVGQPVVLDVEGIPNRQFTGKVTKIAMVADTQNRWLNPDLKEYATEITLDQTDAPLKPGMTAHAEIMVQKVVDKLAVPVQSVFTKSARNYVFVGSAEEPTPQEVELGARGTEWVVVENGLAEGDNILLAVPEEAPRLLPDLPPPSAPEVEVPTEAPSGPRPTAQQPPQGAGATFKPTKAQIEQFKKMTPEQQKKLMEQFQRRGAGNARGGRGGGSGAADGARPGRSRGDGAKGNHSAGKGAGADKSEGTPVPSEEGPSEKKSGDEAPASEGGTPPPPSSDGAPQGGGGGDASPPPPGD
jgi:HlyD family secretion protein